VTGDQVALVVCICLASREWGKERRRRPIKQFNCLMDLSDHSINAASNLPETMGGTPALKNRFNEKDSITECVITRTDLKNQVKNIRKVVPFQ